MFKYNKIQKIARIVFAFILLIFSFLFLEKKTSFSFNTMGELISNEAGTGGIGTTFFYPLDITLLTSDKGDETHNVKIMLNDGFNNIEGFSNNVIFTDGKANILVEINPNQISIEHNVKFSIFVDGVNIGHVKQNLIDIYSSFSKDSKYLINSEGKTLSIDDLVTKEAFRNDIERMKNDLTSIKIDLLEKKDLKKYVILQNGKINLEMLPFSMNNLTCNIQDKDLEYLLEKGLITEEKKKKITLNKDCKDGMTDFHSLIQIIKSATQDKEFLGTNNPKGTYLP